MPGLRPVPIGGGFGSRRRKGHLTKVCLRRKKCERHDGLSAAPWPKRHHSAFRFLLAVLVSQDERSEEHTSELQSRLHLVCRLLLEKKKKARPTLLTYATLPQPLRLASLH